jgi:hypothetical protein
MILRASTRSKIEHETTMLAQEFTAVPQPIIMAQVEATAMRLLEHARFDDYIPLLVYRYVHEALHDCESDFAFSEAESVPGLHEAA